MHYPSLSAPDCVILPASSSRYSLRSRRLTRQAARNNLSEGRCWRSGEYLPSKHAYCVKPSVLMTTLSLQNIYMSCSSSEKLVMFSRIIRHEISQHQSSRFIVYFSTCACVDYFYRVGRLNANACLH